MRGGEKLYKYSGAQFYERYILPSNPASRNPVIQEIWSQLGHFRGAYEIYDEQGIDLGLDRRLMATHAYEITHIIFFALFAVFDVLGFRKNGITLEGVADAVLVQLGFNIYPIAVQHSIRSRIIKVIAHRAKKNRKILEKKSISTPTC